MSYPSTIEEVVRRPSLRRPSTKTKREMKGSGIIKSIEMPDKELKEKMAKVGKGIFLAGGGKKRKTIRAPKGMPKKVSNFIKKHPQISKQLFMKMKREQQGSGIKTLLKVVVEGLKSSLKNAATDMIKYAIEHPVETLQFINSVISLLQAPDEEMEEMSGEGLKKLKKTGRKVGKKIKKKAKKLGKAALKKPSVPIGVAGKLAGVASLAVPELAPVAAGLSGTSQTLKAVGRGKKLSDYNCFVKKHRKEGKSMKEIGAMWRKMKK